MVIEYDLHLQVGIHGLLITWENTTHWALKCCSAIAFQGNQRIGSPRVLLRKVVLKKYASGTELVQLILEGWSLKIWILAGSCDFTSLEYTVL